MKLFSFAASLAILASEAFAMFEEAENLDEASWEDKVINSDEAWMITFYTEWCPYCTKFSDEIKVAKQDNELEGKMVRFGAVNAMTNRGLSKKYNVKRAPTIKVFGQDKSSPVDYLGHRKAGDVVSFLSDYATEQGFIVAPKVEEKEETPAAEELYTYSQEEPIVLGDSAPQAEEEKPAKAEYVPTKATYFYNVDAIVRMSFLPMTLAFAPPMPNTRRTSPASLQSTPLTFRPSRTITLLSFRISPRSVTLP